MTFRARCTAVTAAALLGALASATPALAAPAADRAPVNDAVGYSAAVSSTVGGRTDVVVEWHRDRGWELQVDLPSGTVYSGALDPAAVTVSGQGWHVAVAVDTLSGPLSLDFDAGGADFSKGNSSKSFSFSDSQTFPGPHGGTCRFSQVDRGADVTLQVGTAAPVHFAAAVQYSDGGTIGQFRVIGPGC